MARLRAGIYAGFVAGSTVASLMRARVQDSTRIQLRETAVAKQPGGIKKLLDKAKAHVREAVDAGREAKQEKEEELRRQYEQSMNRPVDKL